MLYSTKTVNEPYKTYKQSQVYKHNVVRDLPLNTDVQNIILSMANFTVREFYLPEPQDFGRNDYYINDIGVVFLKNKIYGQPHIYLFDKTALLQLVNGKIDYIEFFYVDEPQYYYTIDFNNSNIKSLKIVEQKYELAKKDGNIYARVNDPKFIAS